MFSIYLQIILFPQEVKVIIGESLTITRLTSLSEVNECSFYN
jgi:hypothetical protein